MCSCLCNRKGEHYQSLVANIHMQRKNENKDQQKKQKQNKFKDHHQSINSCQDRHKITNSYLVTMQE